MVESDTLDDDANMVEALRVRSVLSDQQSALLQACIEDTGKNRRHTAKCLLGNQSMQEWSAVQVMGVLFDDTSAVLLDGHNGTIGNVAVIDSDSPGDDGIINVQI